MADSPAAQQAAGAVQAQAAGLAKAAKQKVTDEFHDRMPKLAGTARDKVGDHLPGLRHRNGNPRQTGSAEASGDGSFARHQTPARFVRISRRVAEYPDLAPPSVAA